MQSFTITKEGYELNIYAGSFVKLLNFASEGTKPTSVYIQQKNDKGEDVKALLCTLTPSHPQCSTTIVVAGENATFTTDGDDVTVFIDVDIEGESYDFSDEDNDEIDFGGMDDSDEEEPNVDDEEEEVKKPMEKKEGKKKDKKNKH